MKKIYLALVIVLSVFAILLAYSFIVRQYGSPEEEVFVAKEGAWLEIVPEETTRDEVLELLGKPDNEMASEEWEYMSWKEDAAHGMSKYNAIGFGVDSNTVKIIEIANYRYFEFTELPALEKELGEPPMITREGYSQWSYRYIYPEEGLAYLIDLEPDTIPMLVIQYRFPEMTLEEFEEEIGWTDFEGEIAGCV